MISDHRLQLETMHGQLTHIDRNRFCVARSGSSCYKRTLASIYKSHDYLFRRENKGREVQKGMMNLT